MSHEDCRAELREKTQHLLHGALKHVRVAALATTLVPLGALAVRPAVAQDCGSGGCPVTETPTVTATATSTDTPPPTNTMTFTWTPADTATETPTPTETPVPDTPTDTPTQTVTNTMTETATPTGTATGTATDTAPPTNTPIPNTAVPANTATSTSTVTPSNTVAPTNTSSPTGTSTPTQTPTATNIPCPASSIPSQFNRTPIAGGNCIWFNSVINPNRIGPGPTTIVVENQSVQFTANGHPFTVSVPRAVITFDPNVTTATTTFDTVGNQWVTEVPLNFNRNVFMAGAMFPVAGGLPGRIQPVTWSGSFSSDAARVRVDWEWAAAVYSKCDTGLAALGIKPVDGKARNPYRNSDDAGTPEGIKGFVVGGASGDGRPNYTGSSSSTESVRPCN